MNTDFIDNSAGVDCSDSEVNIKILLNDRVAKTDLSMKQRNNFLVKMTDEVADIVLHDNYVKPIVSHCYAENQDEFCSDLRIQMGLGKNAHMDLGNIYWNELARQALFIGIILFLIRMAIGAFLQIQGVRRIRLTTILMALFWGLVGSSLFLFGFLDLLYYGIQGEDVPDQLSWLDQSGVFVESRSWTGTIDHVERDDLILTNVLGLVVIFSFLFVIMLVYSNMPQSRRGIA